MASAAELVYARPRQGGPVRPASIQWSTLSGLARLDRIAGRITGRWADSSLLVDLGDHVGSAQWLRGFATLLALLGAALSLGFSVPTLIGGVPPRLTDDVRTERAADAIGPLSGGSVTGQETPAAPMVRRLAEAPERPRVELAANVGAGGLEGSLRRAGVGRADLESLRRGFAEAGLSSMIRNVAGGTSLDIVMGRRESRSEPRPLESLDFRAAFEMNVRVRRDASGMLRVTPVPIRIDETPLRVTGVVGRSLSRSARAAGVPADVVREYVRQMSHIVDFQHEIRGRDQFDIILEHRRAETGETRTGRLLYAGLTQGNREIGLMRWGAKGKFYQANGEGAKKGLMRTPVDGARMSSGFGPRLHPILGYSRMHRGVDFAAGTGTPVLASASGRVTRAGWGGGYGNIVIIDHGKGLVTRYAHLSKIQVKQGARVDQGTVIGRVGSTGMSTGPHLHYEVWQNGKAVDPRQAKFQSGDQLAGRELASFKREMQRLVRLEAAGSDVQLATSETDESPQRG